MKKRLLITVLLVIITTKLLAQVKPITINKIDKNQFTIATQDETEINLRFNLEPEDECYVLIFDKFLNEISSRKKAKKGSNTVAFTMDQGAEYTIKLICKNPIKVAARAVLEN